MRPICKVTHRRPQLPDKIGQVRSEISKKPNVIEESQERKLDVKV